jgi:hypothetical protein
METQSGETQATLSDGKPRSRRGLIVGGLLGLALLVGAAFVGGRLLNQAPSGNGSGNLSFVGGPGEGAQSVQLEIENAKELPQTPPDVIGIFSRREDNSVFVTAGGGEFGFAVDAEGNVSTTTENGQEVEVVFTNETQIYKDATELPNPGQGPPGGGLPADGKIQQKVVPGSVDEIGENSFVSAWGERRGDRLIARVVMYSQPMIFMRPGSAP